MCGRIARSALLTLALLLAACGLVLADQQGQQKLFEIVNLRSAGDMQTARDLCNEVMQDYAGTKYEGWARLYLAEMQTAARENEAALSNLDRIIETQGDPRMLGEAISRRCSLLVHRLQRCDEAVAFGEQQLTEMGDLIRPSTRGGIVINIAQAHEMADRPEDALAAYETWLPTSPGLLSLTYYWEHRFKLQTQLGHQDRALSTARAAYALCPFTQIDIEAMSNLVKKAYASRGEVFKATQFFAAQEDPEKNNPLLEVNMPEVSDEQLGQMVQAAGQDARARAAIYLYAEDYDDAMIAAQDAMAEADAKDMIQALNEVARVFKAKDLNLVRGNQFLEYAKSGEGVNPLDGFWEEVQP